MREKVYRHGPWVYRYMCRSCGHTVTHPQHQHPCTRCGGDFGHKTSMRKIWLEPVPEPEPEPEPELKTRFERFLAILGLERPDPAPKPKPKPKQVKWRWQFHSEVEDDSGVIRHEEFFK